MKRLLGVMIMVLLTVTVIIDKVDYISLPKKNGFRDEIKITFRKGVMQVPKWKIEQEVIPLGVVIMEKENNKYIFKLK